MRRSILSIFTLLSLVSGPAYSKMIVEKEEYSGSSLVQDVALENYYQRFLKITDEYNANRFGPEIISKSFKNLKDSHKYYTWLKKSEITKLPEARVKNGVAIIQIGEHTIKYSIATLVKNEILINERPFEFQKLSFNQAHDLLKDMVTAHRKFTFMDFLISPAHADGMSSLENSVLATLLYLNSDLAEQEWCIACEDEEKEVTKKNLEKLLSQVDDMLASCENKTEMAEDASYQLALFAGRDDEGGFRSESAAKLKNHFPQIQEDLKDVSCESLVYQVYKEDINPADRNLFVEYYRLTPDRMEKNKNTIRHYKERVKKECTRVAELNACLLNNHYGAGDVYNDSRSPGEPEFNYRSRPSKEYKIRGISQ